MIVYAKASHKVPAMTFRLGVHAAALLLTFSTFACETRDAPLPHQASPPPATIDRLVSFHPAADQKIAEAWARLRLAGRDERETIRRDLARMYEAQEYRAMAAFVLAANEMKDGRSHAPVERVLASRDPLWVCSPASDVAPDVATIEDYVLQANYRVARETGLRALNEQGPLCPLLMETAVVTLALAASSPPLTLSHEEFDLALRTFLTADVELNQRPARVGRSWAHALAARALINYDPPAALVAVEASREICITEEKIICSEVSLQRAEKDEAYIRSLFK